MLKKELEEQYELLLSNYNELLGGYEMAIKDLVDLWTTLKPNETYITYNFLFKEYKKLGKGRNDKNRINVSNKKNH